MQQSRRSSRSSRQCVARIPTSIQRGQPVDSAVAPGRWIPDHCGSLVGDLPLLSGPMSRLGVGDARARAKRGAVRAPAAYMRNKRNSRHIAGESDFPPVTDPTRPSHDPSPVTSTRHVRHPSVTDETCPDLQCSDNVSAVSAVTPIDGRAERNTDAPAGFVLPNGPDRCTECGFHVPTQGHRATCTANESERI